ncbi:MAG: hypothetical protein E7609_08045 [Ruminococcaceae bacterium]|nr:hypothetical protein [Oscillospiraceae bacterium]
MKYLLTERKPVQGKSVVFDDMILTKDLPTTAGSKMLDGYMSLFDAEVVTRLSSAGYETVGKANVGEMCIDVLGETSAFDACVEDGVLVGASAEMVARGDATVAVGLDANGTPRRAAALGGCVCVKPTYGTVSRFGTVSIACSGETVTVTAKTVEDAREALAAIAHHDDKDGTSLTEEQCALVSAASQKASRVAIAKSITEGADAEMQAKVAAVRAALEANGVTVEEIDDTLLAKAGTAWGILMSAELCNNVSRYDGVKYGYRTKNYKTIDELYTNSRTEAFGKLLKTVILYGSETLSTENYMKVYDKALRMRRVIVDRFAEIFESYDAVLLPVASRHAFTPKETAEKYTLAYDEQRYTAPASITGLPVVALDGVQFVGKAFEESRLYYLAEVVEKEAK